MLCPAPVNKFSGILAASTHVRDSGFFMMFFCGATRYSAYAPCHRDQSVPGAMNGNKITYTRNKAKDFISYLPTLDVDTQFRDDARELDPKYV
jgi:hypothetical protein